MATNTLVVCTYSTVSAVLAKTLFAGGDSRGREQGQADGSVLRPRRRATPPPQRWEPDSRGSGSVGQHKHGPSIPFSYISGLRFNKRSSSLVSTHQGPYLYRVAKMSSKVWATSLAVRTREANGRNIPVSTVKAGPY